MNGELIMLDLIFDAVVIGIGATLIMDIWALLQHRLFAIKGLNYALVGRWLLHMPKGIFYHHNIMQTQPMGKETVVGWVAHYVIGIVFAAVFLLFTGSDWLANPALFSAFLFGVFTLLMPYFVMQPCFGLGIAASKTATPNLARYRSLVAHSVFGFGLYLSAHIYQILNVN